MAEQIEKSFQKQQIFHNTKVATSTKVGADKRWYKDVGLGFKVGPGGVGGGARDEELMVLCAV